MLSLLFFPQRRYNDIKVMYNIIQRYYPMQYHHNFSLIWILQVSEYLVQSLKDIRISNTRNRMTLSNFISDVSLPMIRTYKWIYTG